MPATAQKPSKVEQLRAKYAWFDHVVAAGMRYTERKGDMFAAAITYFSFQALFPLLLLAVAVFGFVLRGNPDLMDRLSASVTTEVPGGAGELIGKVITGARDQATGIGIVSLVLVVFTGTGWVANLRTAAQEMWGKPTAPRNFVLGKLTDLLTLIGLGLTMVISIALSTAASSITLYLVDLAGLSHIPGASILTRIIAIAAALLADIGMFYYIIRILPQRKVPFRAVLSGALLGAIALEILKVVATYYLPKVASSPAAGIFGTFIVLLIWINFMARIMLLAVTWTATSPLLRTQSDVQTAKVVAALHAAPQPSAPATSPGAAAAVLIAVGAVAGLFIPGVLRRWWNGAT